MVELIIVISIIAVLASLAFMALSGETAQARDSKRSSDLKTFEDAIATSNGKNKKISFTQDFETPARNSQTSYETTSGVFYPLRGAYLIPLVNGVFGSDVMPTTPVDPRGSVYLGTFLTEASYQLFAALEKPEAKQSQAFVRGSFKGGAIIDTLREDISDSQDIFSVSLPTQFVAGDVVQIDAEYMVVIGIHIPTKKIMVYRNANLPSGVVGANTLRIHNQGAKIRLAFPAPEANGLLCKDNISNAVSGGNAKTLASDNAGNIVEGATNTLAVEPLISSGGRAGSYGTICIDLNSVVINEGNVVPYRVIF